MHLPEKTAYCIWGANRAEAGGPWGAINYPHGEYFTTEEVIERWDTDADGFGIVKADTREEVISKLGLAGSDYRHRRALQQDVRSRRGH